MKIYEQYGFYFPHDVLLTCVMAVINAALPRMFFSEYTQQLQSYILGINATDFSFCV